MRETPTRSIIAWLAIVILAATDTGSACAAGPEKKQMDAYPVEGEKAAVKTGNVVGCPKDGDLGFYLLARLKSFEEGRDFADAHGCVRVRPEDNVIVEKTSWWDGPTCVRPQGAVQCVWVLKADVGPPWLPYADPVTGKIVE